MCHKSNDTGGDAGSDNSLRPIYDKQCVYVMLGNGTACNITQGATKKYQVLRMELSGNERTLNKSSSLP